MQQDNSDTEQDPIVSMDILHEDTRASIAGAIAAFHVLFTGELPATNQLHDHHERFFLDFNPKRDIVREVAFVMNFY